MLKVMTQEQIEIQLKFWEEATTAQLENLENVLQEILENPSAENKDLIEDILILCQDVLTSRYGGEEI